jgi:hypothetical protein
MSALLMSCRRHSAANLYMQFSAGSTDLLQNALGLASQDTQLRFRYDAWTERWRSRNIFDLGLTTRLRPLRDWQIGNGSQLYTIKCILVYSIDWH